MCTLHRQATVIALPPAEFRVRDAAYVTRLHSVKELYIRLILFVHVCIYLCEDVSDREKPEKLKKKKMMVMITTRAMVAVIAAVIDGEMSADYVFIETYSCAMIFSS